jgi:hypothetical protein
MATSSQPNDKTPAFQSKIDRRDFPKRKIPPAKQFSPPFCLNFSKGWPLQATKTTKRRHSSQILTDATCQKGKSRQQSNFRRPFA